MSKKVKFALNTGRDGGHTVITRMAEPAIIKAAERIADRSTRISTSIRSHPNTFEVSEVGFGLPNRRGGTRVYAIVSGKNESYGEAQYRDYQALRLALDAGRVTRLGA